MKKLNEIIKQRILILDGGMGTMIGAVMGKVGNSDELSYNNHEAKRDRKLLLTKKEIRALESATKQTGFTIVPILVFIDDKGRAKVDVALCKGKKEFDKRQTLKEKEDRREMDRAMKVWK